jgi:hypothetical protein
MIWYPNIFEGCVEKEKEKGKGSSEVPRLGFGFGICAVKGGRDGSRDDCCDMALHKRWLTVGIGNDQE